MILRIKSGVMAVLASALLLIAPNGLADSKKPTILKPCKQCHDEEANYLRGKLKSASNKEKTVQIFMGSATWQLTFDKNTELNGAPKISKIGKMKEVGVEFEKRGNVLYATSINVKQPAEIPQEWIINTEQMQKLVAMGPEKGNYTLIDARPGKVYLEGHIEGALSSYDALFDKNTDILPANKDALLVFYCGGPT